MPTRELIDLMITRSSNLATNVLIALADPDSIAAAARVVEDAASGRLFALVNNAGRSVSGPLELLPVGQIEKLMEVNVIGLMAVTQAFLPVLRAARGRIINISSISREGNMGQTNYSATKAGVAAMTVAMASPPRVLPRNL